jgi:hypothetical protein
MSIIRSRHARWERGRREQAPLPEADCPVMRDIEVIDAELRELAQEWRIAREVLDRTPSTELIDQLLDERAELIDRLLDERAAARFTADCSQLWDECCGRAAPIV